MVDAQTIDIEPRCVYTGGKSSRNHKESHGPEARAIMLATSESLWV